MPIRPPRGFIHESDPRVCQIGHPAPPWLVNYADLMTELVCFFVILYALSPVLDKPLLDIYGQYANGAGNGGTTVGAALVPEGVRLTMTDMGKATLFQTGSAEITAEMESLLDQAAPKLRQATGKHCLIVEGHTDDIPIRNDLYESNWQLSADRATRVAEYLIKTQGLPPDKVGALGFGEHQPVCRANTPECRQRNRRVVLWLKNSACVPPVENPPASGKGTEGQG